MPAVKDLTNNPTFRGIEEPVALYFSYVDIDKYDYYEQNKKELKNLKNTCKEELVHYLRKTNFKVVTDDNPLAADPSMMVVSDTGIQTPFEKSKAGSRKTVILQSSLFVQKPYFLHSPRRSFSMKMSYGHRPQHKGNSYIKELALFCKRFYLPESVILTISFIKVISSFYPIFYHFRFVIILKKAVHFLSF